MALIGKIVAITGNALLISNNGDQRDLRLGDNIQTADTIKTPAGVEVQLELANGRIVHIGAEQLVAFADELGDVFVPEASDSAIDVATIDTVIKAIEEGKDINEVLEDTAAGVGGSSNSYGFGFVDLLRINDDLNSFRFVFDSSTSSRIEGAPAVALAETNTAEGVVVTATPTSLVSLSATPSVVEGGSIVYTVTLSNPVHTSPIDVTLSNGLIISIPVGSATGSLSVAAPTDDVYLDTSSISESITDVSGGNIILNINPASVATIVDDTIDTTTVTLTASAASVVEGGSLVYTATVGAAVTGSPLVISLNNG
ncbi:MAG: retention module-containing protein, partial [Methylotenera sp.]|nr:retention module-containing protein [Methylotenera sp.]